MLEGEGPCFYCSAFVTLAGSIPSINSSKSALEHQKSDAYIKAVQQKDKLLRFGREKIAQTTIIDDQGDFYETEANNLWLTQKEREIAKIKAAEQESRLNQSRADKSIEISINFDNTGNAGIHEIDDGKKQYIFDSIDRAKELKEKQEKLAIESKENDNYNQQNMSWYHNSSLTGHASQIYASIQKMMDNEKEKKNKENAEKHEKKDSNNNTKAVDTLKNKFIEEANSDIDENEIKQKDIDFISRRAQNKNVRKKLKKKSKFTDKMDEGVCLSMHQPWASLLVLGIKQVEGRSWPTRYRGRLWIASARREPTPFEIDEVEQQYCRVYGLKRNQIPFPKEYPTTALLGCVDMVNCLSNEEYQDQYVKSGLSTENNASGQCFICENPRRLILPGAISGEHKLWKMPQERIKPMQAGLVPCDLSWIPDIEERLKNGDKVRSEEIVGDLEDDERLQRAIAESLK